MNIETAALLSDAKQTVVYLRNNDEIAPEILIFSQSANVMEALIGVIEAEGFKQNDALVEAARNAIALNEG